MPYKLVTVTYHGKVEELYPIACDTPGSVYGLEDRSIERKAKQWASRLKTLHDVKDAYVERYNA